jgi:branched-chain amino acid transport system permease protein
MTYFGWLVTYGALAGVIYALIALAFVIVYKASGACNFAVGEWVMFGALLTATGLHTLGMAGGGVIGLLCAMLFAGAALVLLAMVFSRFALGRMRLQSPMTIIMLTIGLGAVMRGVGAILFRGTPNAIALPIDDGFVEIFGLSLPPERLLAALIAGLCIALIGWFYQHTRAGLALRAMGASAATASGVGVDVNRYVMLSWALVGVIAVVAGVLWSVVSGGGFGMAMVGLKVFPIVIIGGLGSIPGCIVGAMIIGVIESLASGYLDPLLGSGVSIAVSAVVLLIALWLRPQGLFGERRIARV